jgi:hypothetical protein
MEKGCELYMNYKSFKYIFTQPDLSLRKRRYLELIKDYDIGINYHPRKVNVVVDAWSQRSHLSQLEVEKISFKLCKELNKLNLRIASNMEVMEVEVDSTLL